MTDASRLPTDAPYGALGPLQRKLGAKLKLIQAYLRLVFVNDGPEAMIIVGVYRSATSTPIDRAV